MKREHNEQNETITWSTIADWSCNNSMVDSISNIEMNNSTNPVGTYFATGQFYNDPEIDGRYCIKKKSGKYCMCPNFFYYNTNTLKFEQFLSSDFRLENIKFEFDVYINSSTSQRVIFNDGDVGTGGNGYNGVGLWVYSGALYMFNSNNSSAITRTKLGTIDNLKNKWNHFTIQYTPNSDSSFCEIIIENQDVLITQQLEIVHPTSSNKRAVVLAGSQWGYYQRSEDVVDFFKNIKISKINY